MNGIQVADRPLPPAMPGRYRVTRRRARRQLAREMRQRRRPRIGAAHVPQPGLIAPFGVRDQAVPIHRPEGSPCRDGAHVGARAAQRVRGVPRLLQPSQLLFPCATDVCLGQCHGRPVTLDRFFQAHAHAIQQLAMDPYGLDVDIPVPAIAPVRLRGIVSQAIVEKALAGDVVVDARDVRGAGRVDEPGQLLFSGTARTQIAPERVLRPDAAAQQVEAQPSPLILEVGLVLQVGRCERVSEIVGLHQPGGRVDSADGSHGQHRGALLVEQRPHEALVVSAVGVPVAIQSAEPGGRGRLIDGGVGVQMRIATGHCARVACQRRREPRVEQVGRRWPAAVVHESGHASRIARAQKLDARVGQAPVEDRWRARRAAFPQQRHAHALDAQTGNAVDVVQALCKARFGKLIAPRVAHPVDGALRACPEL